MDNVERRDDLLTAYQRDMAVWDACAEAYEDHIVSGHSDIAAYEAFEEDLLDRILLHLIRDKGRRVRLLDVGCGSGRLHLRYGLKAVDASRLPEDDAALVRRARATAAAYAPEPHLRTGLSNVDGLDFSRSMIEMARRKLVEAGLGNAVEPHLGLECGSAFDLQPLESDPLPVAVSVCNTVGVIQGPAGAAKLFDSMRRCVESAGGIAIITGYRRSAIPDFALPGYESTMSVSGQPVWLGPDTYAGSEYVQVPRAYKRAYDPDPTVTVDVFLRDGSPVARGHTLTRRADAVRETCNSGHIRTHTDYESRWYSIEQFREWIRAYWGEERSRHIAGGRLDSLRAAQTQIAVLDCGGLLEDLPARWGL